jgi:hypothetical protein
VTYDKGNVAFSPAPMDYRILCLWKMDAEPFIRNHTIVMYTLLPAMRGVTVPMLTQAIEEMRQHYPPKALGDHLPRFQKILWRTTMLSEEEKRPEITRSFTTASSRSAR